jgi:hypothetical protein
MRTLAAGLAVVTLVGFSPSRARAQANLVELGVDGALAITLEDPSVTTLAIPIERFRVGFFTSSTLSWEPWLALTYVNVEGPGGTASTVTAGLGLLFHQSRIRTRTHTYMRPFGGLTTQSFGGSSDTDAHLGFGIGVKMPWQNRRLATRLEAFLQHVFADPEGITSVGVLFGLSFFTR